MANANPTRNRIVLRSPHGQYEEAPSGYSGNLLPGHLVSPTLGTKGTPGAETLTLKPHAVVGGKCTPWFAIEDALVGKTILGGYPKLPISPPGANPGYQLGDIVRAQIFQPGDIVFARLQAGQVTTGSEMLASGGDGTLIVIANSPLLYQNVANSTTLTSFTTITPFDKSYTIPANTLQVGDVIKVRASVFALATNSTDTLVVTLKIGSTTIIATAAVDVANSDVADIECFITIRTIGASGTFTAYGTQALGTPGTVTAKPWSLVSTAIDTTAAQAITVNATMSVSSAGNQIYLRDLSVTMERPWSPIAQAVDAVNNAAGDSTVNSTQGTDEFCAVRIL